MVEFPNVRVSAAVETSAEDEGKLLSFKTPEQTQEREHCIILV